MKCTCDTKMFAPPPPAHVPTALNSKYTLVREIKCNSSNQRS